MTAIKFTVLLYLALTLLALCQIAKLNSKVSDLIFWKDLHEWRLDKIQRQIEDKQED